MFFCLAVVPVILCYSRSETQQSYIQLQMWSQVAYYNSADFFGFHDELDKTKNKRVES